MILRFGAEGVLEFDLANAMMKVPFSSALSCILQLKGALCP